MFWSPFSRRDAYNFDGSHTAIDVARYIVAFCTQHGLAIDSIQLQAILYCVQVASLKERHCALFADEIEAWPQGPIVRSVYRKYCGYGAAAIYEEKKPEKPFTPEEESLIRETVQKKLCGRPWLLVDSIRSEGRPWALVYRGGRRDVIPKDVLAERES